MRISDGYSAIDVIAITVILLTIFIWALTRLETRTEGEQFGSDHPHRIGAHGGVIKSFAADHYHAECVLDWDGTLWIYTLRNDETEVLELPSKSLTAQLRDQEGNIANLPLEPSPLPDDANGKTSRFTGQISPEFQNRTLQIAVDGLRIEGKRYRFGFEWGNDRHEPAMPGKVTDAEEQKLYLEPGGLYTEEDIVANGNQTASQAFVNFKARHDFNPQPGDLLCPVTRTKANRQCQWIIGGKSYQFCCPPCVDEFVLLAKSEPEKVRSPEAYVQE